MRNEQTQIQTARQEIIRTGAKGGGMSLDQAIKHGKEKRKKYHGAKACDAWCRNHGYCWFCRRNRLHKRMVELLQAKDKEEECSGKN